MAVVPQFIPLVAVPDLERPFSMAEQPQTETLVPVGILLVDDGGQLSLITMLESAGGDPDGNTERPLRKMEFRSIPPDKAGIAVKI